MKTKVFFLACLLSTMTFAGKAQTQGLITDSISPASGATLNVQIGYYYIVKTQPSPFYINLPTGSSFSNAFAIRFRPLSTAPTWEGAAIILPQVTGNIPFGKWGNCGKMHIGNFHWNPNTQTWY